ncbi:MAG: hypothetical protein RXO32_02580 [Thermoproteus sp.]|nr:hypothetical protein [Thermoproteus sp. CP80]
MRCLSTGTAEVFPVKSRYRPTTFGPTPGIRRRSALSLGPADR